MATHKLIASVNLTSPSSSISFTSIPGTYTDLLLVASVKSNQPSSSDGAYALLELNNSTTDSGGRYTYTESNGAPSHGFSAPNYVLGWGSGSDTAWSATRFYIYGYSTNNNKSIRSETWQETTTQWNARNGITAGFYNSSTPITSLRIVSALGSYIAGSTAYLYGIS